jgi:linoleoyl-CoA desaturase
VLEVVQGELEKVPEISACIQLFKILVMSTQGFTSPKFVDIQQSEFFTTLKSRVEDYFKTNGKSRFANGLMIFKTVFYLKLMVALYVLILLNFLPVIAQLTLAILLGMTMSFIGFNVCHDALHDSYSRNKKVNQTLGFIFNIIGANAYMWKITHNVVHHTYTNISGHDEDIEIAPGLIRVSENDKKTRIQKYQHIYAFFLYGFTTISWFFRKDYVKFFKGHIGQYQTKHPRIEYFNLFFHKLIYYTIFIIVPFLVLDLTWWQFLIGYFVMNFAEGLTLGLVFQLAHLVESTDIEILGDEKKVQESWAVHQLRSTANFATNSKVAAFLCGGLNTQVEHHLFPRICHVHYPALSVIVKQTAHEFSLPYHENKTFFSALQSHYHVLKVMGSQK